MRILIISGFLGAGKTTFIRELVQKTGREIAVLENEYGGSNIDGGILEDSLDDEKVNIWEMTEGCICCSMKGDFAASVLTIANSVDPEVLVIEPTGVGMLSNIIENLQQIEYDRISLLAPVTMVDGNSIERYARDYKGLYADQIASANTVLITKMEHASADELEAAKARILEVAPNANVDVTHYATRDAAWFNGLLDTAYDGTSLKPAEVDSSEMPETLTLSDATLPNVTTLVVMLEDMIRGRYGNIIRAKGCVRVGREAGLVRFDLVDRAYSVTGGFEDNAGEVVFIGHGIARQDLRALLGRKRLNIKVKRKG